jgi:hypothetical protein
MPRPQRLPRPRAFVFELKHLLPAGAVLAAGRAAAASLCLQHLRLNCQRARTCLHRSALDGNDGRIAEQRAELVLLDPGGLLPLLPAMLLEAVLLLGLAIPSSCLLIDGSSYASYRARYIK